MGTHPDTAPFRVHNGNSCRGMLHVSGIPATPSAEVEEMGFRIGDTAAPGLSDLQRFQLLVQSTDLNTLAWTISTIRMHTFSAEHDSPCKSSPTYRIGGYTSSQAFPSMMDIPSSPLDGLLHSGRHRSRRQHHTRGPPDFDPNSGCTLMAPTLWASPD